MKPLLRRTRNHLSPGLVIALVALVVALGGTAFAAVKLKANSVGAKQLKTVVVKTAGGSVAPGTRGDFTANCDASQQILGGGVDIDTNTTAVQLEESHPQGNGWQGVVFSTSAAAHQITVQALCLNK